MNKKGFTLVELLAVIVILCTIVLIASISVNKLITNSRNSLSNTQIKNLEKAAQAYYMSEGILLNDTKGCISVNDLVNMGYIESDEVTDPKTEKIVTGSVEIKYNSNQYSYKYQDKECDVSICNLVEDVGEAGISEGDKYKCKVDPNKDPYTFFVLGENDDNTVNLILERNICEDGSYATIENTCTLYWNDTNDNSSGPVDTLNYLHKSTKNWTNVEPLNYEYYDREFQGITQSGIGYQSFISKDGIATIKKEDGTISATIGTSDYPLRARMPIYTDNVENSSKNEVPGTVGNYWYDYLYVYTGSQGYYTLSSYSMDSRYIWKVVYDGIAWEDYGSSVGVRPVITLNKNAFSLNKYVPPFTFSKDSWDTIADNVRNGNTSYYEVGDTKDVSLEGLGTFEVRIANMSTPEECKTEGFSQTACGFVIEFVDIITDHVMNSNNTNVGGWRDSEMRSYLNNENDEKSIYNLLPQELRDNIIETSVVSGHGDSDGTNFETIDKLYLLSPREVLWDTYYLDTADNKTRQLEYYMLKNIPFIGSSGAIKKYNGSDFAYWFRTATYDYSDKFNIIAVDETLYDDAYNSNGVSPAFRIG